MTAIRSDEEEPHTGEDAGFTDAVTFAFADVTADLYGFVRLALSPPADERARDATAVAVLLSREGVLASAAAPGVPVPADSDWEAFALSGVATVSDEPLERWSAAFLDPRADAGVELAFEAFAPGARLQGVEVAGLSGYAHPCRVQGSATVAGTVRAVAGQGQREHTWGAIDWSRVARVESAGVWHGEETALAVKTLGVRGQEDVTAVTVLGREARAARGETLARCSLDLPAARLELEFLAWNVDGRPGGVGYREVLRPI